MINVSDHWTPRDGEPTGVSIGVWREIWRVDRGGQAYRIWEKIMPRIHDELLDCAVYLYESEQDAIAGAGFGGSGFLVGVPVGWDQDGWTESRSLRTHHIYAVTAAHLIENGFPVIRLNTKQGATKVIDCSSASWIVHPEGDDVAITPIEPDRELHKFSYVSVEFEMFVTKEVQHNVALGPGDETFTVGRFIARDERQSNAPIVRFGHVAGLGTEPIEQGDRNFKQESFLVESHSISGFSGSPVFIWIPMERTVNIRDSEQRSRFRKMVRSYQHRPREYLLGVDWGHLEDEHPPGMAGVVPAWKLLEVLNTKEAIEMRREREKSESKTVRAKLDVRSPQTQKTRAGLEIPVPTKESFMHDLDKATRKRKPPS